ncbi:glycosyltransferase family 39 protein [Mucilaginibacter sp. PAMB04274]|uniref:ArnT family glycosyltransferase n=1 Tax=Mucilaginibacter sp. PAMB04274 TaxID=3138568 RepID=UPI0031F6990F
MFNTTLSKNTSAKYITYFILGWTVLNLLQAATLGIHSDEAYYWMYSRFLDWGYYDHPPMVALFIRMGDALIPNELGLRLMTVISSSLSAYLLWLIARRYRADARWFVILFCGVFAFNIYGFTTTPDAPLLLFSVLFYYVYQQYLEKDSWPLALLLGVVIALLLYSKYHGVLLLFFTLLANLKVLKRLTFWVIPVLTVLLYLPHILWQVNHGYPSVNYHLFERSSAVYEFSRTLQYIPAQLLMAGPLVGWLLFYYSSRVKVKDAFIRCLVFNAAGMFIFFWLNTAKGNVQPHWTLIGFVPLLLLVLIRLKQTIVQPVWAYRLAFINAAIIVLFRVMLIAGVPFVKNLPTVKNYFYHDEWAAHIKQKAGNNYVIMPLGFQPASKYNYYTRSLKGFSYDVFDYRRTQYELWPIEDSLQHKKAYYLVTYPLHGPGVDSINTKLGMWYGKWVNNVRTYQKIDILSDRYKVTARPGEAVTFKLQLVNPYSYTVNFGGTRQKDSTVLRACFYEGEEQAILRRADPSFNQLIIPSHQKANYTLTVKAPNVKGKYDLIFSIRTTPFPGGRNSRIVTFTVQ